MFSLFSLLPDIIWYYILQNSFHRLSLATTTFSTHTTNYSAIPTTKIPLMLPGKILLKHFTIKFFPSSIIRLVSPMIYLALRISASVACWESFLISAALITSFHCWSFSLVVTSYKRRESKEEKKKTTLLCHPTFSFLNVFSKGTSSQVDMPPVMELKEDVKRM